jgi:ribosomal protein S18 acetylase RimI-like enzyme
METIRKAELGDSERISELHCMALSEDLLPSLGKNFLEKVYYPAVLKSSYSRVYLFEKDRIIVSFVVFATDTSALSNDIKSTYLSILFAAFKKTFVNPRIPFLILGFIFGKAIWQEKPVDLVHIPELYSIATDPSEQSKGYGRMIVKEGLKDLGSLNEKKGCIVKTTSEGAFKFYQSIGFRKIGFEKRGKSILSVLYYDFKIA